MSRRDWISYQPISSRTSPITRSWIPYGRRTTSRTILDSKFLALVRPVEIAGKNGLIKMEGSKGEVVILILFI